MLSFGITENLQLSASLPLAMTAGDLPPARMMSLMSSDRELEALAGYRFQRRTIGIGGRQESTLYVGGTVPFESRRGGVRAGPSLELGIATGYASRAHYVWIGGAVQHYRPRGPESQPTDRLGDSRLATVVYGYARRRCGPRRASRTSGFSSRPPLRIEARSMLPASTSAAARTRYSSGRRAAAAQSDRPRRRRALSGISTHRRRPRQKSTSASRSTSHISSGSNSEGRHEYQDCCGNHRAERARPHIRPRGIAARRAENGGNGLRDLRPRRARGHAEDSRSRARAREPEGGTHDSRSEARQHGHVVEPAPGDQNNGFVAKDAEVVARGTPSASDAKAVFEVSGTRERLTPATPP